MTWWRCSIGGRKTGEDVVVAGLEGGVESVEKSGENACVAGLDGGSGDDAAVLGGELGEVVVGTRKGCRRELLVGGVVGIEVADVVRLAKGNTVSTKVTWRDI